MACEVTRVLWTHSGPACSEVVSVAAHSLRHRRPAWRASSICKGGTLVPVMGTLPPRGQTSGNRVCPVQALWQLPGNPCLWLGVVRGPLRVCLPPQKQKGSRGHRTRRPALPQWAKSARVRTRERPASSLRVTTRRRPDRRAGRGRGGTWGSEWAGQPERGCSRPAGLKKRTPRAVLHTWGTRRQPLVTSEKPPG